MFEILNTFNFLNGLDENNTVIIPLIILWSLAWKGVALWKSAHKNSKPWFIALLLINSVGILEMFYIFVFSKKKREKEEKSVQ